MTSRPVVRRTYGKAKLAPSSSSSSIYLGSSDPIGPSSPPSSSFLATPPTSPGLEARDDASPPSSPSPKRRRLDNVDVLAPPTTSSKVTSQSSLMSYFAAPRGNPLQTLHQIPSKPKPMPKAKLLNPSMTQMHLTHLPRLHTCQECLMSYMRGGSDEALHSKHHAKVVRGIAWDGLGKGKAKEGTGWRVLEEGLHFGDTGRGRVVVCDGSWGGLKLDDILATVDTVLSSPPLPSAILDQCKIFLYLTPSSPPSRKRQRIPNNKPVERVVSVVVAQPIKEAMRVLRPGETFDIPVVDSGGGVVCDPTPLPTPLGIHRLYTIPSYRQLSLVTQLLDAACSNTIYGCTFDPAKGEVAFSQPTESGRKVMEKWGKGHVRVFADDERQL